MVPWSARTSTGSPDRSVEAERHKEAQKEARAIPESAREPDRAKLERFFGPMKSARRLRGTVTQKAGICATNRENPDFG